jgi:hypothetical protein
MGFCSLSSLNACHSTCVSHTPRAYRPARRRRSVSASNATSRSRPLFPSHTGCSRRPSRPRAGSSRCASSGHAVRAPPPLPPFPRTNRTRLVPPPVLTGHAASSPRAAPNRPKSPTAPTRICSPPAPTPACAPLSAGAETTWSVLAHVLDVELRESERPAPKVRDLRPQGACSTCGW